MRKNKKSEEIIEIVEDIQIPGTDIILEAGDQIQILSEADYYPSVRAIAQAIGDMPGGEFLDYNPSREQAVVEFRGREYMIGEPMAPDAGKMFAGSSAEGSEMEWYFNTPAEFRMQVKRHKRY
jgi:hypothetical protein